MAYQVTLYTFSNEGVNKVRVYTSSANMDYIGYETTVGSAPSPPINGTIVSETCKPGTTTKYTYRSKTTAPYATITKEFDSAFCGGTPPVCDLAQVSFVTTPETGPANNDATANMFATSSYGGIMYALGGPVAYEFQDTGYFTSLTPGDYVLYTVDSHDCQFNTPFTIEPFDTTTTHFKYKLEFDSVQIDGFSPIHWEVRFFDMLNNYPGDDYPIDIYGNESPLVISQADQEEAKETTIISKNITCNLVYDGLTFTPDEFSLAPERQWKVEVYKDSVLDFQGWVLPDETQDEYNDPSYVITVKATDGLPSLKGNSFGDGSGGYGYSAAQVPQYGVAKWAYLVKQCLDQLGYDYGNTILVNSLQYFNSYDSSLWAKIGTWSDIMYDSEGVPTDTYSALQILLGAFKLTIIQWEGRFVLLNWNDIYYLNNPLVTGNYNKAFYEFSADFTTIQATGTSVDQPVLQQIGFDWQYKPANRQSFLNYDKAYNVRAKIDFNYLALLYPNPSFEIGAVEGGLPPGFEIGGLDRGSIDIKLHNDGVLAYLGNWILTEKYHATHGEVQFPSAYISLNPPIEIDQPNKFLNISFFYRANQVILTGGSKPFCSSAPDVAITFFEPSSGIQWKYLPAQPGHANSSWDTIAGVAQGGGSMVFSDVTDYQAWNSASESTLGFPGSGIGQLNIYFFNPVYAAGTGDPGFPVDGSDYIVDIDQLVLTLGDASDSYNKQIGETHLVTAVTGIPQANTKDLDIKLFTYPNNKRVAGNVFSTGDYVTGNVFNTWKFALNVNNTNDRLPATVTQAFSRAYQRPMRIFEGDIQTNYLTYYGMFQLRWYENTIFMPYSIELDCRNNIAHVVIIEIDDNISQTTYTYTPLFEKSARQNI